MIIFGKKWGVLVKSGTRSGNQGDLWQEAAIFIKATNGLKVFVWGFFASLEIFSGLINCYLTSNDPDVSYIPCTLHQSY
jgi:hypothetical protein